MKRHHIIFLSATAIVFLAITIVFLFFPRSTFSEIERRELATFPQLTSENFKSGEFNRNVSSWFSDSEPFREQLMQLHLYIKDLLSLKRSGSDNITFVEAAPEESPAVTGPTSEELESKNRNISDYENKLTANANAKIAHAGIVIVGEPGSARAFMAYGGSPEGGKSYADVANLYKRTFGPDVNVYCMVVPTAIEFYCPDKVKQKAKSQSATIRNIYAHLSDSVKAVDVYTTLGRHASEPVFLRTDHHWAPLGAYYAARKFAQVAGVPFLDMTRYQARKIPGFVGTMYGYSKDISIKKSPEDFIYYTPLDTAYTTTFINFNLDKDFKITSESRPKTAPFFKHFKARGMAYSTFMGGDAMIVKVNTSVKNGRRLIIIKDSFGNAIPPFLFGSFEEIHVLDHRYFPRNIVDYVKTNRITDFLFLNNIFNAYSEGVCNAYRKLLKN